MISIVESEFYKNATWDQPIEDLGFVPGPDYVELFDQNGYRLTPLEGLYSYVNNQPAILHRSEYSLKKDWFLQEYADTGAVLNHGALFERKGYSDEARQQLESWARSNNLIYKLLRYRPKWGVDFSVDYVDQDGNAFEIVHYEYDGFNLDEIIEAKARVEEVVSKTDWNDAAKELIKKKDEWINLEFFEMSDYKCNYFGLGSERFKLVAWE